MVSWLWPQEWDTWRDINLVEVLLAGITHGTIDGTM